MKQIFLAASIAFLLFSAYQVDIGNVMDRFSIIKKDEIVKDCPVTIDEKNVSIGTTESKVSECFGNPYDTLLSEYGFYWNIYHENFKNYTQIGIKDGVVVAVYTNSSEFLFEGIAPGAHKDEVRNLFGEPLDGIVKGNTRYLSHGNTDDVNFDLYKIRGAYVTFFYDTFKNNSLTSVNIIDCDVEESFDMLYAPASDELKQSFETQNFYVANAARMKEGLDPFFRHEGLDELAFNHSFDMTKNEYFSHTGKNGDTVLERAQRQGINFRTVGENLAMGSQNSIYMHELLMNSEGHRKNILGDFTNMGAGIAFAGDDKPYLTQNFLK